MKRHTNPTTIGAFVVGAIVLIAVAFAVFGGSQIFATKIRYVALFDEPTNGLRVGANVMLNGVRIGYVSDIDLLIDEVDYETETQVTMEILTEDFILTRDGEPLDSLMSSFVDHELLVHKAGLRAMLEVESFVTGQLRVELQFRPETMAILRAAAPPYPEIPTITSNIQAILDKVQNWFADIQENVDIPELSRQLSSVLAGIDRIVYSDDVQEAIAGVNKLVNDEQLQNIGASVELAAVELREAARRAKEMFDGADASLGRIADDIEPAVVSLEQALDEISTTLRLAQRQLKGDSEQVYQLEATIGELERAARSIREFFDYIERNPEALLRGKQE